MYLKKHLLKPYMHTIKHTPRVTVPFHDVTTPRSAAFSR